MLAVGEAEGEGEVEVGVLRLRREKEREEEEEEAKKSPKRAKKGEKGAEARSGLAWSGRGASLRAD